MGHKARYTKLRSYFGLMAPLTWPGASSCFFWPCPFRRCLVIVRTHFQRTISLGYCGFQRKLAFQHHIKLPGLALKNFREGPRPEIWDEPPLSRAGSCCTKSWTKRRDPSKTIFPSILRSPYLRGYPFHQGVTEEPRRSASQESCSGTSSFQG